MDSDVIAIEGGTSRSGGRYRPHRLLEAVASAHGNVAFVYRYDVNDAFQAGGRPSEQSILRPAGVRATTWSPTGMAMKSA